MDLVISYCWQVEIKPPRISVILNTGHFTAECYVLHLKNERLNDSLI